MPPSVVQEGGKRRKSKASRKSKKSMKGGAIASVAALQEGGKRRKSRKSKKSMKGGASVADQEGGKRRKSRKSKKSMKGGADQEGGKRRKSRKSKKSMKGGADQEGGKRRKSRKSKKSRKSIRGGAAGFSAPLPAHPNFKIDEQSGMMQYMCGGCVTMVMLKGMYMESDQKLHGWYSLGVQADGARVLQLITIEAVSAEKCQIKIVQTPEDREIPNAPAGIQFTQTIELPGAFFGPMQAAVVRFKDTSAVDSIVAAAGESLKAHDPKRNHAIVFPRGWGNK